MSTGKQRDIPAPLATAERRFARWRKTRQKRTHIPNSLWALAVTRARTYGVAQTARILRLDYYRLRKRVEQETAAPCASDVVDGATFVELTPPVRDVSECLVELEDNSGAKMRIHLKGTKLPDLVALGRSFWGG